MSMPMTPNPPVNTGTAPDVDRPMPCDPPGTRDAAGWTKTDAGNSDGWDRIDDVDGGEAAGWMQC